jgi:adenosylcobinamide kinase / adenosylcobinamide-phosphate guanylyltransferase
LITLVLGGTRSGKSEVAESLVAAAGGPVTYVATAQVTDDDMAARIAAHRVRRPSGWATVEAGADLAGALTGARPGPVLVDSLGTWVAAHDDLAPDISGLCRALRERAVAGVGDTVVVSEEVGLGVHATTAAGRRFADALGDLNRAVADEADRVLLVMAGRILPLDTVDAVLTADRGPADDRPARDRGVRPA